MFDGRFTVELKFFSEQALYLKDCCMNVSRGWLSTHFAVFSA
jgi:hypothetical protein